MTAESATPTGIESTEGSSPQLPVAVASETSQAGSVSTDPSDLPLSPRGQQVKDVLDEVRRSAAVHTPPPLDEAGTMDLRLFALQSCVNARWFHPDDDAFAPLVGAKVIAAGFPEFRRDLIRDLEFINRTTPGLVGRENWHDVVHAVWKQLKLRLDAWSTYATGSKKTAREVIRLFDKHYKTPRKPTLATEQWTITDSDVLTAQDGTTTGWKSSGVQRTGTLQELARDLVDTPTKQRFIQDLEEGIEAEKRGEEAV